MPKDQSSQDLPEIDVMGVWLWPRKKTVSEAKLLERSLREIRLKLKEVSSHEQWKKGPNSCLGIGDEILPSYVMLCGDSDRALIRIKRSLLNKQYNGKYSRFFFGAQISPSHFDSDLRIFTNRWMANLPAPSWLRRWEGFSWQPLSSMSILICNEI